MLEVGNFKVDTLRDRIKVIRGEDSVEIMPAEASKASSVVGVAMRVSNFKVLPPEVQTTPFEVAFNESGLACTLRRIGETKGCSFDFNEGDDLLRTIEMGLNKVIDTLRIEGGAKAGASSINYPDPPIIGRG